jgi:hypothetical protein
MSEAFDHEKRTNDLRRLLHELDLGMVESVEDLDEDVLEHLCREIGSREELERLWDRLRGTESDR